MKPSGRDQTKNDPLLDEAAANWLYEREKGFEPGREAAFAAWLEADPRHRCVFSQLEQVLGLLGEMPAVMATSPAESLRLNSPVVARRWTNPWGWAVGLAAALAVGLFIGHVVNQRTPVEIYEVEGGLPRRESLADGSVVDLNVGSRLEVRLDGAERRITLVAGEAHFQVAPDRTRPFVVTAGGVAVRALGTAFNVSLVREKVDVLVTAGRVEVKEVKPLLESHVPAVLSAGERTEVVPAGQDAPKVARVDRQQIRTLLAWQDRVSNFTDVPLREIVDRINRCTGSRLVIADEALAEKRIGGVIALNQVDAFIEILGQSGNIVAERHGEEIILHSAR